MTIHINGRLRTLTLLVETAGEQHADYRLQQDGWRGNWTLTVADTTNAHLGWWRTAAACYDDTTVWQD